MDKLKLYYVYNSSYFWLVVAKDKYRATDLVFKETGEGDLSCYEGASLKEGIKSQTSTESSVTTRMFKK